MVPTPSTSRAAGSAPEGGPSGGGTSPSVAPLFCPFGPFILFYSGLLFYFILAHSSLATNSLSCGAGSIFLTNPHGPGKMCTEDLEPGGRGSIQLPVKGLHR